MNLKGTLTKIFFFRLHTLVLQCACFMYNVFLCIGFIDVFLVGKKENGFYCKSICFYAVFYIVLYRKRNGMNIRR